MFISTAKYLEDLREAEKRGYKKGADAALDRIRNQDMEGRINSGLREIRKEIRDLRWKVGELSEPKPRKLKKTRMSKGVGVIILDHIKSADTDAKPETIPEAEQNEKAEETVTGEAECPKTESMEEYDGEF